MRLAFLFSGLVVAVAGCGQKFRPMDYPSPEMLLSVSEDLYRRGKCGNAQVGFRQVTASLPLRDSVAVRARFLLAECLFAQADYLEAARQFRRVADEATNHPLAPRALLRAGDSQTELWKRPELDPTYGQAATGTYQEVIARYPRSEISRRAGLKLASLGELFAEKEYKNGTYYLRFGAYDSAILYFKAVVADYGASVYAPLALVKLVEIYHRVDYVEEARETCANLRRFYPDALGLDDVCQVESTVR